MEAISSSFRDRSGYVFLHNGIYYRAVNKVYKSDYDHLIKSGLYEFLIQKKFLIPHQEVNHLPLQDTIFTILQPDQIPTISYAYEWSFSMLKDAALCPLYNALHALEFGMILKDANTFNIQFINGLPILIDTLSFEKYNENEEWIAYRQFCENFIAPLVLMKYCNASLNKLLQVYPHGIPLDICKSMLPFKAQFNFHVYLHVFLQSKISTNNSNQKTNEKKNFSKQKLVTLLQGLKTFVSSLNLTKDKTTWDNYYDDTILSQFYLTEKKTLVKSFLDQVPFQTLLDLGANDGEFSMLYKNTNKQIISLDEDRNCIEKLYQTCKKDGIQNIIPLVCDLTSPSPNIGWNNEERSAMFKRLHPDIVLALALIHHLAIANNLPLEKIISFFHSLSEYLLIEFVPKEDPKVQQLLAHRKDVFDKYDLKHFKICIQSYYDILKESQVADTSRTLFLLKRKG